MAASKSPAKVLTKLLVLGLRAQAYSSWTRVWVGSCPHPLLTLYIRDHINGYIYLYYKYYPTVNEWGQYLRFGHQGLETKVQDLGFNWGIGFGDLWVRYWGLGTRV